MTGQSCLKEEFLHDSGRTLGKKKKRLPKGIKMLGVFTRQRNISSCPQLRYSHIISVPSSAVLSNCNQILLLKQSLRVELI